MAFDERLAERIRPVVADIADVSERPMFGGVAFLIGGHMARGILGEDLMLRLGEARADAAGLDLAGSADRRSAQPLEQLSGGRAAAVVVGREERRQALLPRARAS